MIATTEDLRVLARRYDAEAACGRWRAAVMLDIECDAVDVTVTGPSGSVMLRRWTSEREGWAHTAALATLEAVSALSADSVAARALARAIGREVASFAVCS